MKAGVAPVVEHHGGHADIHSHHDAQEGQGADSRVPVATFLEHDGERGEAEIQRAVDDGHVDLFPAELVSLVGKGKKQVDKTYREEEDNRFTEQESPRQEQCGLDPLSNIHLVFVVDLDHVDLSRDRAQ